jgi:ATP-dependent DNA ligase
VLKRRNIVQDVLRSLPAKARIRQVEVGGRTGTRLYEAADGLQLEGIVAKRADAPYKRAEAGTG